MVEAFRNAWRTYTTAGKIALVLLILAALTGWALIPVSTTGDRDAVLAMVAAIAALVVSGSALLIYSIAVIYANMRKSPSASNGDE